MYIWLHGQQFPCSISLVEQRKRWSCFLTSVLDSILKTDNVLWKSGFTSPFIPPAELYRLIESVPKSAGWVWVAASGQRHAKLFSCWCLPQFVNLVKFGLTLLGECFFAPSLTRNAKIGL